MRQDYICGALLILWLVVRFPRQPLRLCSRYSRPPYQGVLCIHNHTQGSGTGNGCLTHNDIYGLEACCVRLMAEVSRIFYPGIVQDLTGTTVSSMEFAFSGIFTNHNSCHCCEAVKSLKACSLRLRQCCQRRITAFQKIICDYVKLKELNGVLSRPSILIKAFSVSNSDLWIM